MVEYPMFGSRTSSSSSASPDFFPSALSASLRSALLCRIVIPREARDLLLSALLRPSVLDSQFSTPSLSRVHINIIPWNLRFLCFHTLTHSFAMGNPSNSFPSRTCELFTQNTRVGAPLVALSLRTARKLFFLLRLVTSLPLYFATPHFTCHGPPATAHV